MNKFILCLMMALAWMPWAMTPNQAHAEEVSKDRSDAPYFIIEGAEQGQEHLPLESTEADVDIAGTIAKVSVRQTYRNRGTKPIEAIYVFPGSTRAAVYGLTMRIGEREIKANIKEKEQARADYEQAKSEGKTASLLEQHRPNVFQMNVANILPGDVIEVELDYVEALTQVDGEYEFVYPAVVGPRFVRESDEKRDGWAAQQYLKFGEAAPFKWDLNVSIDAGMPITKLKSQSHTLVEKRPNPNRAEIGLSPDKDNAIKDFVLRYSLRGKEVNQGLLLFEGKGGENFFLAMVQPPAQIKPADRPSRNYVFIVDVSGSMHGYPLDTAKATLARLLKGMSPRDTFNVLTFSMGAKAFAPKSMPATQANIASVLTFMDNIKGGGSTELLNALGVAYDLLDKATPASTFVAITDGYVTVEKEAFQMIRQRLDKASFFAFGIGNSVNRHLIEGMARAGQGDAFIVQSPDESATQADRFAKYIESPVLAQLKVNFEGFDAYDVSPSVLPTVYGERPTLIFGKYKGPAKGSIVLSGVGPQGQVKHTLSVSNYKPSKENEALRYLWARAKVQELSDLESYEGKSSKADITKIGLTYSLMTEHTSFIAVDSQSRTDETSVRVNQPLPNPIAMDVQQYNSTGSMPMSAPTSRRVKSSVFRSEEAEVFGGTMSLLGGSAQPSQLMAEKRAATPAERLKAAPNFVTAQKGSPARLQAQLNTRRASLSEVIAAQNLRPGVTLELQFEFDASGRLMNITWLRGNLSNAYKVQIERVFRALSLGALPGASSYTVTIQVPR